MKDKRAGFRGWKTASTKLLDTIRAAHRLQEHLFRCESTQSNAGPRSSNLCSLIFSLGFPRTR